MTAAERLAHLAALWRRERRTSRERFAAERRERPLAERVARGQALRDLELDETDAAPGGRVLAWLTSRRPGEIDALRAGGGDPVRLWWGAAGPDDPEASVTAILARRRGARLAVMLDGDLPAPLADGGAVNLDRDDPQATFDRGDRALARFRDATAASDLGRLREVLLGDRAPTFARAAPPPPLDAGLNPPQLDAVARALAAEDVALIHGPPGTGKTRALVEVIRQAAARGERVLATAASNAAVDNLAERLCEAGLDVVRLGHPARVSAAMEPRTLEALLDASEARPLARRWLAEAESLRRRAAARRARGVVDRAALREMTAEAGRLSRDARRHLRGVEEAILARAQVICATAAGADAALLADAAFDLVVVDEATQSPDPVTLCACARGRRVVLAGDPCQLPPTVIDLDAAQGGLGETLFERLAAAGRGDPLRLLVVQHRMHETLMAFPSASKYGGRLVAAPAVARRVLDDLGVAADPLRAGPLVFLDAAGAGWEEERAGDDPSTRNPSLAARVAAETRRLLARGLPPADLAVITPYDAQVRLLRELLAPELDAGLEVGSIDGFQGREKEAVVLDLVRSNPDGEIGFLADTRRMNVALTRARRWLLVAGDSATLGGDPYYAAFLDFAERAGAWVSAFAPL